MGRLFTGFLLSALLTPSTWAAEGLPIRDGAKLFSPDAVARATDLILELQQKYSVDFVLETTKALPAEVIERLKRARNAHRAFTEYAEERAQSTEVQGVFVLISTMPDHQFIGVVVRPEQFQQQFGNHQREHLRKLLAGKLKKYPDEALLKAVEMVRDTVRASRKESAAWAGWMTIVALIGGLLALWMLLGLLRMWLHAGSTVGSVNNPTDPLRPGFMPGLLGGMFGSVAGLWIYDRFFEGPPVPRPPALAQKPFPSSEPSNPHPDGP